MTVRIIIVVVLAIEIVILNMRVVIELDSDLIADYTARQRPEPICSFYAVFQKNFEHPRRIPYDDKHPV